MGINKGDRLTIYMPTTPEAIILMLATVRIGAIHSVVFAGFGAKALGDRIQASGSKLVFTADVTYRKGKDTRLKEIVDEALTEHWGQSGACYRAEAHRGETPMHAGRDMLMGTVCWQARPEQRRLCQHGIQRTGIYSRDLGHDGDTEAGHPYPWRLSGAHCRAWASGCLR